MRKITEDAYDAFCKNKRFKRANTCVIIKNEVTEMLLFGNCIAKKEHSEIFISNGGWNSRTTVERLNAFSVKVRNFKGDLIINEKLKWDGEWINLNNIPKLL